jgi:glycosyltransferase involved in cell wall biosynthesis
MTPLGKRLYPTTALSNAVESKIERKVIEKADLVLANTEAFKNQLVSKYFNTKEEKFLYLSNGYDAAAFEKFSKIEKYKKFTICYTGTLYLGRSPEPILKAFKEILKNDKYCAETIRLLLVGNCNIIDGRRTSELISAYNLKSVVKISGPIPHRQTLEIICKSHLALILAPNQPVQIPGKVFEYIGAGTKILAIAGKGATADLITKNEFGKVFAPEDVDGIKRFILQEIAEYRKDVDQNTNNLAEKFNRSYLVEKLAAHLNQIF